MFTRPGTPTILQPLQRSPRVPRPSPPHVPDRSYRRPTTRRCANDSAAVEACHAAGRSVWRSVSMGTGVPPSVMTCGWEIPELNGHVFLGNRKSCFSPSILGIIIPWLDELFAAKRRTRSISMRKVKGETITRRRNRKLHLLFAHVISL